MLFKQPLADLMRPKTLDEMVEQKHLLAKGKPLYSECKISKKANKTMCL